MSLAMEFAESTDGHNEWYKKPPPAHPGLSPECKIAAAHNAQMGEWDWVGLVRGLGWRDGSGSVCFVASEKVACSPAKRSIASLGSSVMV